MSNSDELKDQDEKTEDHLASDESSDKEVDMSDESGNDNETEVDTDTLTAELEAAQKQLAEGKDQLIRMQAELDNQRKRASKQVEDAHKFASQKMVEAVLPVMDSLEMGMQAEGDLDSIREGMGLTMKQFEGVLDKFNIESIDPKGETFDPELHQAMSMQPCEDQENNTVSMVMQKGYTLNGRLIRPAMVMVCKNS